jgi:hypothetical protein
MQSLIEFGPEIFNLRAVSVASRQTLTFEAIACSLVVAM